MSRPDDTRTNCPLAGTTVIELGHIVAGPFCSLVLSNLGADVIKVEHGASGGDSTRTGSPLGTSVFNALNHSKRSVTLDLKTEAGLGVFYDLIAEADVFVENVRPGVSQSLGIAYEDLKPVNKKLIYCSIKGFNPGPYETYPALDPVAEALSGLMSVTGHPGNPPTRAGTSVADMAAALFGAIGVTAALKQRENTGEGQHISAPLFESTVSLMGYWLTYAQAYEVEPQPLDAGHENWAPYNVYRTGDDQWIFLGPSSQEQWKRCCEALELELHHDERFETLPDRRRNQQALDAELAARIEQADADSVFERLRAADVPVAHVRAVGDVPGDEHLVATNALREIETVVGDDATVAVPQSPLRSTAFDRPEPTNPPELGGDTTEVLSDLGYSNAEIARLRERGAITGQSE